MNTQERIRLVCSLFEGERLGFKSEKDLLSLIENELGHALILDGPVPRSGVSMQALAPDDIYHICASNLDVSAEMSLLLGLLLGSKLAFKLPSQGLPGFEKLARRAGDAFGQGVDLLHEHDPERMRSSDAVVVFGSDETVDIIRSQLRHGQRFLAYGQKISVGLVLPESATPELAAKAVEEMVAYEQSGCLSPQAYLCPDFEEAEFFAGLLAQALEKKEQEKAAPAGDFENEGIIFEARQRAILRGNRVWGAAERRPWTVVLRHDGFLEVGPGRRFIQVIPGSDWESILRPWKGKLSSLSLPRKENFESVLPLSRSLGFSRICLIGDLQKPCLSWRHDGRPRLGDLVTWITLEK